MTTAGRLALVAALAGACSSPDGLRGPAQLRDLLIARLDAQGPARDRIRDRRQEQIQQRQERLRQRQDELRQRRNAARQGPVATDTFTKTVRIGREGAFSLVNASGSVTVTAGSGEDVRIDAVRRAWQPTEAEARALLSQIEVQVVERTGAVDVRTVLPPRTAPEVEVEYTITVPAGASVSVRGASGDIKVSNVRGGLTAESVAGAITVTSAGQVRSVRSVSGTIQLDSVESQDLAASTLNGRVILRRVKARVVDLRSVGGDVDISDSDSERLSVRSLAGRVSLSGRLSRTGRYTLQSQSGDISVIPGGAGDFEIEAMSGGDVRSDFALTLNESRAGARGRGRGARVVRGVAGEGGALLSLQSATGNITIAKR